MNTLALSGLSYFAARFIPSLVLSVPLLYSQMRDAPIAMADLLTYVGLFTYWSAIQAVAFVLPIAFSPVWRRIRVGRAVVIAGGLGLVSHWVSQVTTALTMDDVMRIAEWAPWLSTPLLSGIPGVILGFAAPWIAKGWEGRRTETSPTD
jgi:hypothetical protein